MLDLFYEIKNMFPFFITFQQMRLGGYLSLAGVGNTIADNARLFHVPYRRSQLGWGTDYDNATVEHTKS